MGLARQVAKIGQQRGRANEEETRWWRDASKRSIQWIADMDSKASRPSADRRNARELNDAYVSNT